MGPMISPTAAFSTYARARPSEPSVIKPVSHDLSFKPARIEYSRARAAIDSPVSNRLRKVLANFSLVTTIWQRLTISGVRYCAALAL